MASPMLQEIFGGALVRRHPEIGFPRSITDDSKTADRDDRGRLRRPALAVQHRRPLLLGLAVGQDRPQDDLFRLLRSSASCCYGLATTLANVALKALFVAVVLHHRCRCMAAASRPCRPISPTCSERNIVGAIHGRLLTAWSTAGIVGPVLVNYLHESRRWRRASPRDHVYDRDLLYRWSASWSVGLIANALVRPVAPKWLIMPEEVGAGCRPSAEPATGGIVRHRLWRPRPGPAIAGLAAVGIPLAWGVYMTLLSAVKIFQ